MSVVIDSSVTLAWIYSDERTEATERVFDIVTEAGAWVPMTWHLEVANGLQQGIRQRRIGRLIDEGTSRKPRRSRQFRLQLSILQY